MLERAIVYLRADPDASKGLPRETGRDIQLSDPPDGITAVMREAILDLQKEAEALRKSGVRKDIFLAMAHALRQEWERKPKIHAVTRARALAWIQKKIDIATAQHQSQM